MTNRDVIISAILLAAGESRRMGQLKQLMPFSQSTIVEQAVDNVLNSSVKQVIVVLGYRADEVVNAIGDRPVKVVTNPDYHRGMSTSIMAGLKMVDSRARAVMLTLGDQPLVDGQTIDNLVEAFTAGTKGIAVPVYRGRRGHPVIFDIRYKDELLKLEGDIGGREIIARNPDDVLEVAVDCEGVCIDIDDLDSYDSRIKYK